MFRLILLKLLLVSSLCAVGSDFYEGLASGEFIGDLKAPDSFGEVSNADLAQWSPDNYELIASSTTPSAAKVDSLVTGAGGLALPDVTHALSNQGGFDHAARHLSDNGLLEGNPNSKISRADFRKHATRILMSPDATIDLPEGLKRGQVPVKGYVGKVNGKDVIVWIAQKSGGKRFVAGQIVTAYTPSITQLNNFKPVPTTISSPMNQSWKTVRGALVKGVSRAGAVMALDQGSEALINQINDPTARQATRAGKESVLLYNFPVTSLLNLQGSTPQRTEKQVDSTTRVSYPPNFGSASYNANPNAPENIIYAWKTEPQTECFDSQNQWDITKWRFCSQPKRIGEIQRYGVAINNGERILVPYGSLARE